MGFITKENMELMNIEGLDKDRQKTILGIKNNLDLGYESTLEFASSASKNLTEFSSDLLRTMKVKDSPEIEELLTGLLSGLSEVDADTLLATKHSFLKKLFRIDNIKGFIVKYEDISGVMVDVKNKLEKAQFQLKKDIEVCSRYLEQNMKYINELDDFILAGGLKVSESNEALSQERSNLDSDDLLAVHEHRRKQDEVDRLDRKIFDLRLMREIGVQNIPQIMLIRQGDYVLIEKMQSSINSAIPLWESQMVIAVQLMRQKGALAIQKAVTDTTNKLIAKNSELLKSGSIEIAKELERGIVDVDVLKKSSENLIKTLEEIKAIREDGKVQRIKATEELDFLQGKLSESMLLPDIRKGDL